MLNWHYYTQVLLIINAYHSSLKYIKIFLQKVVLENKRNN